MSKGRFRASSVAAYWGGWSLISRHSLGLPSHFVEHRSTSNIQRFDWHPNRTWQTSTPVYIHVLLFCSCRHPHTRALGSCVVWYTKEWMVRVAGSPSKETIENLQRKRWFTNTQIERKLHSPKLHSLKLTAKAPENRPKPNRKRSSSNHPFSGAKMLNFGRVLYVCITICIAWGHKDLYNQDRRGGGWCRKIRRGAVSCWDLNCPGQYLPWVGGT